MKVAVTEERVFASLFGEVPASAHDVALPVLIFDGMQQGKLEAQPSLTQDTRADTWQYARELAASGTHAVVYELGDSRAVAIDATDMSEISTSMLELPAPLQQLVIEDETIMCSTPLDGVVSSAL
jgi:hypothetical protein